MRAIRPIPPVSPAWIISGLHTGAVPAAWKDVSEPCWALQPLGSSRHPVRHRAPSPETGTFRRNINGLRVFASHEAQGLKRPIAAHMSTWANADRRPTPGEWSVGGCPNGQPGD